MTKPIDTCAAEYAKRLRELGVSKDLVPVFNRESLKKVLLHQQNFIDEVIKDSVGDIHMVRFHVEEFYGDASSEENALAMMAIYCLEKKLIELPVKEEVEDEKPKHTH